MCSGGMDDRRGLWPRLLFKTTTSGKGSGPGKRNRMMCSGRMDDRRGLRPSLLFKTTPGGKGAGPGRRHQCLFPVSPPFASGVVLTSRRKRRPRLSAIPPEQSIQFHLLGPAPFPIHFPWAGSLPARNFVDKQTGPKVPLGSFWLLPAFPGSSWLRLSPPGTSCHLLAHSGSSWILLAPSGSFWLCLAPPGSSWLLMALSGSFWLFLAASGYF
jgi:hypothetical protein